MTGGPDVAELALSLVNIHSVSRQEREITGWIADFIRRSAPSLKIHHLQPDAIVFGFEGPTGVVLAGHSDTVPAQGNFPGRLEGDGLYGLGASDMKGGLAVMLALARSLPPRPAWRPLFVIFGGEELAAGESVLWGLFDACPLIAEAGMAVMMEPTGNRIQAGCLGNLRAELVVQGVAAHSARPWLGRNAIHEAVRLLSPIAGMAPNEVALDGLVFREVLSVTEMHGGVANNVIPDRVACGINFRYAGNRDPEQAEERLRELIPEGDLRVLSNSPGAPVDLSNPLLERLRQAAGGPVIEPKQAWTPVAEFAQKGITAVNFGPGDPALAHRQDEAISVAAMESSLAILRQFIGDQP